MLVRELRGWARAVKLARELWPDIPAICFARAGDCEAQAGTFHDEPWWSVYPALAASLARAALRRTPPASNAA
jgi:hypothetical protein